MEKLNDMVISPEWAAMTGYDIDSDIDGAKQCGMKGILIITGKNRVEILHTASVQPNNIVPFIAMLTDLLMR